MPEFQNPVDIANRALQRVGASRIGALGFNEISKQASETAFVYGKLRQAELQRNIWTFATKKAALRPIGLNTAIVQPTLWNGGVTYFVGSIVQDQTGSLWESTQRDNIGNQPGINLQAWIPYFGPLTSEPFHSTFFFLTTQVTAISPSTLNTSLAIAYHKGELVHTIKGDGTFNVYKSLADGNGVHPALVNQWSVNTVYKTDDVVNVFPAWSSLTTYAKGQTVNVTDSSGNVTTFSSLTNGNLNNNPSSSGANWAMMPTLTLMSEINPNITPSFPQIIPGSTPVDEWDPLATYSIGSFVMWNAAIYVSLIGSNSGNYPSVTADWVQCTGGTIYQSLVDFNQGNAPAASPTQWTTTFVLGGGNSLWIQIGGAAFPNGVGLKAFQLTYPIGSGPVQEAFTKNAYRLPAGYLRKAPPDPSAGRVSWLGAPGNRVLTDWVIEGNFIVTADSMPIVFRFVADEQDFFSGTNAQAKALFCEMLSCSIALEICEPLTQSTAKKQVAAQEYKMRRTEAISVNGIEVGAQEPPLDDLIACRL